MTKRGIPLKTLTKTGTLLVFDREVSTYMWSLASIQWPSRMWTLPRYTILHIFTITVSEQPNAQRPVVQAFSPKTKRIPGIRTGNISDLRAASVCFIHEETHSIPCILYGGGRIQSYWSLSCGHAFSRCVNVRTTTRTVVTAVVRIVVPEMLQVKCSVHNVTYILLYTRTAVVVDPHNEVPYINSRYYTHDIVRVHIEIACFVIPAWPPTTLGWPGLRHAAVGLRTLHVLG